MRKAIIGVPLLSLACVLFFQTFGGANNLASRTNHFSQYKIVSAISVRLLSLEVEMEMTYGWQPVGGVTRHDSLFYQAIVR